MKITKTSLRPLQSLTTRQFNGLNGPMRSQLKELNRFCGLYSRVTQAPIAARRPVSEERVNKKPLFQSPQKRNGKTNACVPDDYVKLIPHLSPDISSFLTRHISNNGIINPASIRGEDETITQMDDPMEIGADPMDIDAQGVEATGITIQPPFVDDPMDIDVVYDPMDIDTVEPQVFFTPSRPPHQTPLNPTSKKGPPQKEGTKDPEPRSQGNPPRIITQQFVSYGSRPSNPWK